VCGPFAAWGAEGEGEYLHNVFFYPILDGVNVFYDCVKYVRVYILDRVRFLLYFHFSVLAFALIIPVRWGKMTHVPAFGLVSGCHPCDGVLMAFRSLFPAACVDLPPRR
jgi:hypothetical protein